MAKKTPSAEEGGLGSAKRLGAVLGELGATIDARAADPSEDSYTSRLLARAPVKPAKKLIEEAGELGLAVAAEDDAQVEAEAADLLYHFLVALRARNISLDAVARALEEREGLSGLAEKAARKS